MLAFSAPDFILVQGLFYGLGYGLLALGLVLVYRTNRVLNFAQGQIGVIAAVFLVKLTADFKFNYWFSLVLSVGLAALVGALSELVLRRLFNRPRVLVMVATIGLGSGCVSNFESDALSHLVVEFSPLSRPLPKRPPELRNCATNWRSFSLT